MRRIILLATVALLMTAMLAVLSAGTAAAHPHEVKNPNHDQQIAPRPEPPRLCLRLRNRVEQLVRE